MSDEPIVPGTNIGDMPPPPPSQVCLAFDPATDATFGEVRCDRLATEVIILGFVPTLYVPVCRAHAARVIESAHRANVFATQGGV